MLVRSAAKAVLLNLKNPDLVTTVIPTARKFKYRGKVLVAVPHRDDETKILRNMGFDAPPPISYYYDWPGKKPYAHQEVTAGFLTLHNRAFCLNDMGSGKTLSVLWAYDFMRRRKRVNKMLVVTPMSTMTRTWGDEIFSNFPDLTYTVLHGTKSKRLKLLEQEADIYIINHDGVKVIQHELAAREDIDVVVVDEVQQAASNASTERWKALHAVTHNREVVWGLTGTPTPNAPTEAWAQCRLICPERVPKYFGRFRDLVMRKISEYKWLPRNNAMEVVAAAMQPSIRYRRDECIDLPPVTYETFEVEMSEEQRKAYKTMLANLAAEYEGNQITAVNEGVKAMKLVQIACGLVYGDEGKKVSIPAKHRLQQTKEIVEMSGSKTIVFVPFVGAVEMVAKYLSQYFTVEVIYGEVSKSERDRIFAAFQRTPNPHVLVAQPAAMSHGLTLTAASTIVWYAPVASNGTYEQANARITRPGQKLNQLIAHIEGSPIERKIYERLQQRGSMQGLLLSLLKDKSFTV